MTSRAAGRPISFAEHVKPLFRPKDRQSMSYAFDLWDVDDVRLNARAILGRLRAGTMPCDGGWGAADVELFRQWIVTGEHD